MTRSGRGGAVTWDVVGMHNHSERGGPTTYQGPDCTAVGREEYYSRPVSTKRSETDREKTFSMNPV